MRKISLLFVVFAVFVSSCMDTIIDTLLPDEEKIFVNEMVNNIKERNYDIIIQHLNPEYVTDSINVSLEKMTNVFNNEEIVDTTFLNVQFQKSGGITTYFVEIQYSIKEKFVYTKILYDKEGEKRIINNFYMNRSKTSLTSLGEFNFENLTATHVMFLFIGILMLLFCIFVFIICLKSKFKKKKWLWCLFILVGVMKLSVNLTTGALSFSLISFSLLPISFIKSASPYSPWIYSLAFPLGAFVFLFNKNRLEKAAKITEEVGSK